MDDVLLVSVDAYRTHQYTALVGEYRGLISVGLDRPNFLESARLKWGLDHAGGELAYREAEGI